MNHGQNSSQDEIFNQLNECPEHVAVPTNFVECNFMEDKKSAKTALNFKNSPLKKYQEINLKKNLQQVGMSP